MMPKIDQDGGPFGARLDERPGHPAPVISEPEDAMEEKKSLRRALSRCRERMMRELQHFFEMRKIGGQRKARCVISPLYGSRDLAEQPSDASFPKRKPKDRI